MRERLRGITGFLRGLERDPDSMEAPGCSPRLALFALGAIALLVALYVTGRIAYDFTLTPEERAAGEGAVAEGGSAGGESAESDVDPQLPGEPYLDGRQYAITATGDGGTNRIYTLELLGEGDTGEIRVWEDETGRGNFTITGEAVRIEMERMVPPEDHQVWEPNVFEGTLSEDAARIEGTWTRQGWGGLQGEVELTGEWESYGFYAERL